MVSGHFHILNMHEYSLCQNAKMLFVQATVRCSAVNEQVVAVDSQAGQRSPWWKSLVKIVLSAEELPRPSEQQVVRTNNLDGQKNMFISVRPTKMVSFKKMNFRQVIWKT